MSVEKPTAIEIAAQGLSQQQLDYHLREFSSSPMRGHILHRLSLEIKKERQNLDEVSSENLSRLQGRISALKWLHTVTEQNFQKPTT